jgi:glycogen debranching enzyme
VTSDPWTFTGQPVVSGGAGSSVTLVEGTSFSIATANGDIEPGGSGGLFFEDTRFVSTWRLRLDEEASQSLALLSERPFAAIFISRGLPHHGEADSTILIRRSRFVGNGMREDVIVQNLGREAAACTLEFELDADFAHLFEVKENRVRQRGTHSVAVDGLTMSFAYKHQEMARGLDVTFPDGAVVSPGIARLDVIVPASDEWRASIEFRLTVDGEAIESRYHGNDPEEQSTPAARLREWEQKTPRVCTGDKAVDAVFSQSERDLGALRIFDPEFPDRTVIAAGAPWFMTLFGRDSLITSLMTLDVDPSLATGTLLTLARMQGVRSDELTEEQPGKILHETRRGMTTVGNARAGSVYYGSIDATPLFVVTLGELHAWGASEDLMTELIPHADRALAWIEEYGDRDGDGFVEYRRSTDRGLANQGWKDSFDGVSFASGKLADAPIALCEVQGYVYAAYLARANIARGRGDLPVALEYEKKATRLKEAFNEWFWLEAEGYFAMGLDADKRPIDSLTSNMGHCLWTGIVDEDKAERAVEHLCGPTMFTGWGIRTLATSMSRYNPVSYHNGSVWPHDSAICAAGLARYGFLEEAQAVTLGLFQAAEAFGGRLPELFCGFDRDTFSIPVPYPASCAPQAWASASPFWLLRTTVLHLEPSIPNDLVACRPHIPGAFGHLSVDNLILGHSRLCIEATGTSATISGLPEGTELVGATRS